MTGLREMIAKALTPQPPLSAVPRFTRDDDPSAGRGSSLENPNTSWDRIFQTERTYTGKSVSEISSLGLAPVWRCVNLIAGTLARTPFMPYRRTSESGRVLARDHYLWPVLMVKSNPFQTAYRWKRLMQAWTLLWGNSYSLMNISGRGQVTELWPLRPDRMRVFRTFDEFGRLDRVVYEYTTQNGTRALFHDHEILHIRGLETDGLMGLGPIHANRQGIGLGAAAEEYGARWFGQGVHLGGYLASPNSLSAVARKNIDSSMNDLYGGLHGAHKLGILEEGLMYHETGVPPEDMQFLQTRQFQAIDIARLFGVPPHKIAELARATFSNIEQQAMEFVQDCMDDWFVNWEQECMGQLLSEREASGGKGGEGAIELDFYEQKLTRGDMLTRYRAYGIGRQNTFLSPNAIFDAEGMNQIDEPWANDYLLPLNSAPAGFGDQESEDPDVADTDEPEPAAPSDPAAVPGVSPIAKKKAAPKKKKGN